MKQENYLYRILSIDYLADGASAKLEFLPGCPVYKGHFPGLPITPGVLLLTVVREIVEKIVGTGCEIESVRNVKFLQVLTPESNPVRVVISELERIDEIDGKDCTGETYGTGKIDCTSGIDRIGKINCIGKIDSTGETDVTGESDSTDEINRIGEIDIIGKTDSGVSDDERSRKAMTIRAKASIVSCGHNEQEGYCGQGCDGRGQGDDGRAPDDDGRGQGCDGRGQGDDGRAPDDDGRGQGCDGRGQGDDGRGQGECTTFAKMSITLKTTRR